MSDDRRQPAVATSPRPGRPGEHGGFDLSAWLDLDRRVNDLSPGTPPDDSVATTTSTTPDSTGQGFGFADWLATGDGDLELLEASDPVPELQDSATHGSSRGPYGIPADYRTDVHPTLVATVALFLTAATLAVLTVGGVLPPLGPASGLPA